jgi:hypothetical protein
VANPLNAPSALASPEEHADWLELQALAADDHNSSFTDLIRAIKPAGTIEELVAEEGAEDATPGELLDGGDIAEEGVAESAFSELDNRQEACGGAGYPFERGETFLQAAEGAARTAYVFLLALAAWGVKAGPGDINATDLFEDVCAHAAAAYFGGSANGVCVYPFGFPRRRTLPGFIPALNELSALLGEGGGARDDRPSSRDQKDARLDLVVWKPFPDGRHGKLIAFGQCAAGANWHEKLDEMQADHFIDKWLRDAVKPTPTRMFFCPFRIESRKWQAHAIDGGIIFDRCRIAAYCSSLEQELLAQCVRFSEHALGVANAA